MRQRNTQCRNVADTWGVSLGDTSKRHRIGCMIMALARMCERDKARFFAVGQRHYTPTQLHWLRCQVDRYRAGQGRAATRQSQARPVSPEPSRGTRPGRPVLHAPPALNGQALAARYHTGRASLVQLRQLLSPAGA